MTFKYCTVLVIDKTLLDALFNICSKLAKHLSFLCENKLYQSIYLAFNIKRGNYWYRILLILIWCLFKLEALILRFISSVRYWYAFKVNFHQIYWFIIQLFSSWNEFNTWESKEGGRALFFAPDLSNFGSYCCKISLFLSTWWNKYYFT